jgi:hypothetical protein
MGPGYRWNWSLRIEIGRSGSQREERLVEIGSEILYCVSVVDAISSDCVSGVKIKTVSEKSNNFFSIIV